MSTDQLEDALFAHIQDKARLHFGGGEHYLTTAAFGSVFLERHLDFLKGFDPERSDDNETVQTLLEISEIVDCVQNGQSTLVGPERDEGFVSDRFRQFAPKVEFAPRPLSDEQRARYENALRALFSDPELNIKTDDYAQFCILRSDLSFKKLDLLEKRRQLDDAEGTTKETLETQIQDLLELIATLEQAVDALDHQGGFSDAEDLLDRKQLVDFPESVRHALDTFDLFVITSPDPASHRSHVQCSFFPSGLAEDNWTRINLTGPDLSAAGDGGLTGRLDGFDQLADAHVESMEFDLQMVSIERPWCWPELFWNKQWRFPDAQTSVSDGQGNGLIPAYIAGLAFARNLIVYGSTPTGRPIMPHIVLSPNILSRMKIRPDNTIRPMNPSFQLHQVGRSKAMIAADRPMVMRRSPAEFKAVMKPRSAVIAQPLNPIAGRHHLALQKFDQKFVAQFKRFVSVQGRVTAPNGRPVAGALVTSRQSKSQKPISKKTGADGTYAFTIVGGGKLTLEIARPGFKAQRRAFTAKSKLVANFTLQPLAQSHDLIVKLTDSLGNPFLGEATILIKSLPKGAVQQETNAGTDEVRFPMPAGRYEVIVTSAGAKSVTPERAQVSLNGQKTITVRIDTGVLLKSEEVQLIAFVCRRVPKSPDHDPSAFT